MRVTRFLRAVNYRRTKCVFRKTPLIIAQTPADSKMPPGECRICLGNQEDRSVDNRSVSV